MCMWSIKTKAKSYDLDFTCLEQILNTTPLAVLLRVFYLICLSDTLVPCR